MPEPAAGPRAAPKSDIEIAQAAVMRPIAEVAEERLGIPAERLEPYGRYKAKVLPAGPGEAQRDAKLVLVTAITPTPAGEGKTTTTVGLGDGLNRIGKRAAICLREPSLGPCFGVKGGAAGGGYAQVVPMEDINLHFTGDIHAIGAANNLLAALIDNHLYWGNAEAIDGRRISWRRALDLNDRALRRIACGLGGPANGFPREDGFDITAASEVMAILCLATDRDDLQRRLSNIVVGFTREKDPVRASALDAHGAMAALLRDALNPNLVQTLEHTPAFVHGGPFANIAHGCNSVMATRMAMGLADYVITEAGFGADLGAEKFFDIKCRKAGLAPDVAVLVATVRALKMHGGVARDALGKEDVAAVEAGCANLARHAENLGRFGVPVVVSLNRFSADTEAEIEALIGKCDALGIEAAVADQWARGERGPWRWLRPSRARPSAGRHASPCFILTRCRSWTRSVQSPATFTGPRTSPPMPRFALSSTTSKTRASGIFRCASPRPSTVSRPIPGSRARPRATSCRSARCGWPRGPSSWSSFAAIS